MKFRKKPIVIEAVEVHAIMRCYRTGAEKALPQWVQDAYKDSKIIPTIDGLGVHTLEGTMRGKPDAWLIKGVKGELYICDKTIFEETYEPVDQ